MRFNLGLFLLLLAVPIVAFGVPAHAVATYLDLPDGAQSYVLATDKSGNLFVVSTVSELSGRLGSRITKTNPLGATLATMDFGAGYGEIVAAAVDPAGNLVLAGGTTGSVDFPLVSPLISNASGQAAFVVKVDSQLQNILFSTLLGGTQGGTYADALAFDGSGNIFVTGGTLDPSFPVTPGAFQPTPPPQNSQSTYAFVTEISADDKKIVFSTFLGSDHVACTGCLGAATSIGVAIALDAAGNVAIGVDTSSDQLPVTPAVFGPTCGACPGSVGYMAKLASDGSKLLWATYIPYQSQINAMAVDSSGNVIIGGASTGTFPVIAGGLQTTLPDPNLAGFVAKFDSSAQQLLFSTYFGGGYGGTSNGVAGLTLDAQGNIWITGSSTPSDLPASKGTPLLGSAFVAELSDDGSTLLNIFTAPDMAAGRAIVESNAGTTIALGLAASLVTVSNGSGPSLLGVANAAGSSASPSIAPLELISLYGINIGPSTPASAQVVNGVAPNSFNGVTVSIGGMPAGILYVGPTQINAVVPSEIFGETAALEVSTPQGTIQGTTLSVRTAEPQVFLSNVPDPQLNYEGAAAVNQDGTLNTASNPAELGSIVSVWVSGAGLLTPDGFVSDPVSVLHDHSYVPGQGLLSTSLEVLYAGQAPDLVTGLVQVNFRLPATNDTYALQLQVYDAGSGYFLVYTK